MEEGQRNKYYDNTSEVEHVTTYHGCCVLTDVMNKPGDDTNTRNDRTSASAGGCAEAHPAAPYQLDGQGEKGWVGSTSLHHLSLRLQFQRLKAQSELRNHGRCVRLSLHP